MFEKALGDIVERCEGAFASVLMGFDGIAVEVYTKSEAFDVQTVSMEFSFVLAQIRKAASILEVGNLREVSIKSQRLTFVVRVLTEDYFLALAIAPAGNYGKGRYLMRVVSHDLCLQL